MDIKERIIQEASDLFTKNGIRSITMDDIARHMGISKRTIYENFRDKDELVLMCIESSKQIQRQCKHAAVATSSNVLEAIYQIMFEVAAHMNQVNPAFITDLRKYHHNLWKDSMIKHQEEHIKDLRQLINKGLDDGIFRGDINVEIVTRMLNLQLREITNDEIFPTQLFSRGDVFVNIIINFTRGISTPKGIKIIEKIIEKKKQQQEQH
jgi:TetR/AcrR family transcriptional regulator, cholesterol catabolism regulator